MKILITGGTGLLGTALIEMLLAEGHEIIVLSRRSPAELEPSPYRVVNWPPTAPEDINALQSCDAAINLAGESISGGRWTAEKKHKIRRSRVEFTQELLAILRGSTNLKTFISSSAIGFYGDRKSELLTEESPVGEGFLASVCREWEAAANKVKRPGVRVALLRTGVVLDRRGGFLKELEPVFQNGLGGPVGSGDQFLSWIHIKDWCQAVLHCLNNPNIYGPVNLVAPEPVTNRTFAIVFNELFHRTTLVPTPAFALRLALGEMSALALDSQNVQPQKLLQQQFQFQFTSLREALWDIYDYENQKRQVHNYYYMSTWLPAPPRYVFEFFTDTKNLEKISPPESHVHVEKKSTSEIIQGTLIDIRIKAHGVPLKLRTHIEKWDPPNQFIDQTEGLFAYWRHSHRFLLLAQGTLVVDEVHYRPPLGPIGRLLGSKFIQNDLDKIFRYRRKVLREIFTRA